jgi:adenylyltransferase/sulfurtransferase
MALSDAQIDRFSRQIVLPQIGGTGQERLLRSAVALAGEGELATSAALYLTGAGVGRITLHGSHQLRGELRDLNPDVEISLTGRALGSVDADVLIACQAQLAGIDAAAAIGRPLVAGGSNAHGGWLVVADGSATCASCAARHANFGVRELAPALGWVGPTGQTPYSTPTPKRWQATALQSSKLPHSTLSSATAGVVGSLMSLAVLKLLLGLHHLAGREWLQFDAVGSTLTAHPIVRAAECPRCAAALSP